MKRADGAVVAYPLIQAGGGGSTPTSALQLRIDEINMRLACDLNRQWHSMLPRTDLGNMLCGNMSVAYAAEFDNRFFAVAIWSQPIIAALCDGHTIELRRLAVCGEAPKNTASRMIGVMRRLVVRKFPFVEKMVSYQAVDVHMGTIYKASGWKPAGKIVAARPQRMAGSKQRSTGPLQTHSRKMRWEYDLRGESNAEDSGRHPVPNRD